MNPRMKSALCLAFGMILVLALLLAGCTRPKEPQVAEATATQPPPAQPTSTPTQSLGTPPSSTPETPEAPTATPLPTPLLPSESPQPTQVVGPQPAPTAEAGTFLYTVQAGDTLFTLAVRYGTTMQTLAELNGIGIEDLLSIGQQLKIPGSAPAPSGRTYTVQSGDTLFRIALTYGVSWEELARVNNIADPSQIYVGQKLVIPDSQGGTQPQPPVSKPSVHTVQSGETLWGLAQRYGVTVEELAQANGLTIYSYLYVGQVLNIP